MPIRYREALVHTVPKALEGFAGEAGEWLYHNRKQMTVGGTKGGGRWNHEIIDVDKYGFDLSPLRKVLTETLDTALEPCGIEDFDIDYVEIHAAVYHHGAFFEWHDDSNGYDNKPILTRRLTFAYYMHVSPKMFQGGELEFQDGTLIQPDDGTLVMFNPRQIHRIRSVECWSSEFLHGRFSFMGWLHSKEEIDP